MHKKNSRNAGTKIPELIDNITEVIKRRSSWRTYQLIPIEEKKLSLLRSFIAELPKGPFGNDVRFELLTHGNGIGNKILKNAGTYGVIKGAKNYIVGIINSNSNSNQIEILMDFGYLLETIILYATSLNLGTCWLGGTFSRSDFSNLVKTKEGEYIPAITPIGYPTTKRGLVDTLMRFGANSKKRKSWEKLFYNKNFDLPLKLEDLEESHAEFAEALEMVRLAPSASNKQPWRIVINPGEQICFHFYLERDSMYSKINKLRKTTDLQLIDMGIALNHFDMGTKSKFFKGNWKKIESHPKPPSKNVSYMVSWSKQIL